MLFSYAQSPAQFWLLIDLCPTQQNTAWVGILEHTPYANCKGYKKHKPNRREVVDPCSAHRSFSCRNGSGAFFSPQKGQVGLKVLPASLTTHPTHARYIGGLPDHVPEQIRKTLLVFITMLILISNIRLSPTSSSIIVIVIKWHHHHHHHWRRPCVFTSFLTPLINFFP